MGIGNGGGLGCHRDAAMSESVATDPADLGLLEAAALLRSRALSAVELLEACQARIAARNGWLLGEDKSALYPAALSAAITVKRPGLASS